MFKIFKSKNDKKTYEEAVKQFKRAQREAAKSLELLTRDIDALTDERIRQAQKLMGLKERM